MLLDTRTRRIVSNGSADLLAMLNAFNPPGASNGVDLRPQALVAQIDVLNDQVQGPLHLLAA